MVPICEGTGTVLHTHISLYSLTTCGRPQPSNLLYAKVILAQNTITVNGAAEIDTRQPQQHNPISKVYQDWGIQVEVQGLEQLLVEAIKHGQAVAVSNGSFQEQAGSAAWTIKSTTKQPNTRTWQDPRSYTRPKHVPQ